MKISIIGAGSWGCALSRLLSIKGHDVCVWSIDKNEVQLLEEKHEYPDKLPGVLLPENITFTSDLKEAVMGAKIMVLAVPSKYIRSTSKLLSEYVKEGQIIVNVSKGIEEDTLMTMSEIIKSEVPTAEVAVLSGPSHAEEVGKDIPTAVVVTAYNPEVAEIIRESFRTHTFRIYITPDILGVELGGALKNVIALAAGIADGLGCGDNTKAALITRGIAEMKRLGSAMGADSETFSGLSGIGDLVVTCESVHSRNRRAGILIGQGKSVKEAMDEVKMIVEGVYSAKASMALARKYRVSMPIIEEMYQLLFENKSAKASLDDLLDREKRKGEF